MSHCFFFQSSLHTLTFPTVFNCHSSFLYTDFSSVSVPFPCLLTVPAALRARSTQLTNRSVEPKPFSSTRPLLHANTKVPASMIIWSLLFPKPFLRIIWNVMVAQHGTSAGHLCTIANQLQTMLLGEFPICKPPTTTENLSCGLPGL